MLRYFPAALISLLLAGAACWSLYRANNPEVSEPPPNITVSALSPTPSSIETGKTTPLPPALASAPESLAENKIREILRVPSPDHATTAGRLGPLVLDPDLPSAQRADALAHILNLSAGHESTVLLPLVIDRRLSDENCRAILEDALNQSTDWQAEVYLAALRTHSEPKLRAFIREHLGFLTGRAGSRRQSRHLGRAARSHRLQPPALIAPDWAVHSLNQSRCRKS